MGILTSGIYSMTFDAASVARLGRLINAAPVFAAYYTTAMNACVNRVQTAAKQNAADGRFQNPTGNLMRGITGYVRSPWEGVVGVREAVPYARRRELGFVGTDALGRTYNDPGYFYLRDGLEDSRPFISATFRTSTQMAVASMII